MQIEIVFPQHRHRHWLAFSHGWSEFDLFGRGDPAFGQASFQSLTTLVLVTWPLDDDTTCRATTPEIDFFAVLPGKPAAAAKESAVSDRLQWPEILGRDGQNGAARLCCKSPNTTHGGGWKFQFQPTEIA